MNMKTKYAEVTVSRNRNSFVLNQTTKPTGVESRSWKVIAKLATGTSPRLLAQKAKALGYVLVSDPSPASFFYMRGNERRDWNGDLTNLTGLEVY